MSASTVANDPQVLSLEATLNQISLQLTGTQSMLTQCQNDQTTYTNLIASLNAQYSTTMNNLIIRLQQLGLQ